MLFKALCNPRSHARKQRWGCATKTFLVMRLTGFLLLAAVLQVSARGTAQTVTYSARGADLPAVFAAIEQQTGYVFFYDRSWLAGTVPVTVELKDVPLREALEKILAHEPVGFEIKEGNTIVLTRGVGSASSRMSSPPDEIHGRVTDTAGNPLMGA